MVLGFGDWGQGLSFFGGFFSESFPYLAPKYLFSRRKEHSIPFTYQYVPIKKVNLKMTKLAALRLSLSVPIKIYNGNSLFLSSYLLSGAGSP